MVMQHTERKVKWQIGRQKSPKSDSNMTESETLKKNLTQSNRMPKALTNKVDNMQD